MSLLNVVFVLIVTSQSVHGQNINCSCRLASINDCIVTFFALLLSALSAILNTSLPATLLFVVSFVGDNWLGVATNLAPVPHTSVSACISPSVAISTTHAAVVLAFGVAVPVSTTSHKLVVRL